MTEQRKNSKEGGQGGSQKRARPGRAEMVIVRNMYALMMSRRLAVISMLSVFCALLSLLSAWSVVQIKTPPQYIQLTEDGRIFPLTPLTQSNVNDGDLIRFASDTVKGVNTYDYVNWRDQLQQQSSRFTEGGWKAYLDSLTSRDTITSVQNRRMVVTPVFKGPSIIEKQGPVASNNNRYTWIVKVPVEVRYLPSDTTGESISQEGVVTLYVVRVPLATNQRGYAVWLYQFDTRED